MKSRERFKKRWERWLDKQDRATRGDIVFRDSWLKKPCQFIYQRFGIRANHITGLGISLLFFWILIHDLFQIHTLALHLSLGVLIGATDFVDGPLARNNDDVTAKGILGDYFRDFFYVLYMERVALKYNLHWTLFFLIATFELFAIYFKLCAWYRYAAGRPNWNLFFEFAEDNFQSNFYDRFQFTFICVGILVLVLGDEYKNLTLFLVGNGLLAVSLGIGLANLKKEATWAPTLREEEKE